MTRKTKHREDQGVQIADSGIDVVSTNRVFSRQTAKIAEDVLIQHFLCVLGVLVRQKRRIMLLAFPLVLDRSLSFRDTR
jgi:hypothetical protein